MRDGAGQDISLKEPKTIDEVIFENEETQDTKCRKRYKPDTNDDKTDESQITIDCKTVKRLMPNRVRRTEGVNYKRWKQHTMTIFRNSFVYPFVHANNKYKCFLCSKLFLESSLLKEHTITQHTRKEMDRGLDEKARDMYLKVDVTCLKCAICFENLNDLQTLKIHLKYHGKEIDPDYKDNLVPFKLGDKVFECQICKEKYLKLRLLVVHMNKHFHNFNCEFCGSVFVTLRNLRRHQETHGSDSYPCDKCDKIFSSSDKRRLHVKAVHLKHLLRSCPLCSERFNSNYTRTKHLRIVHNQTTGLYRCEICAKEFDLKYHLMTHSRMVHMKEKNEECSICNARFFWKDLLKRHMTVHTGERNYKCGVCGRTFARRQTLKEHAKSHKFEADHHDQC